MAAATVEATNSTTGDTAATNKACNLPSGIVADSLLILVLRSAGADTHSTPSGWTALDLNNTADGSNDTTSIWYKVAAGSEGGSVTVNGTASLKFASVSWRVHNYDKAIAPEINTVNTGTNNVPVAAALAPSGGPKDFLYANPTCYEGEQTVPPNYSNGPGPGNVAAGSGTGGAVATNCRANISGKQQLNSVIGSFSNWLISAADDWSSWVIAIHPGSDPVVTVTGVGWYGPDGWF